MLHLNVCQCTAIASLFRDQTRDETRLQARLYVCDLDVCDLAKVLWVVEVEYIRRCDNLR